MCHVSVQDVDQNVYGPFLVALSKQMALVVYLACRAQYNAERPANRNESYNNNNNNNHKMRSSMVDFRVTRRLFFTLGLISKQRRKATRKWALAPLARPWECSQSGGQDNNIFLHENRSQFPEEKILFCPPDWLHSHDVQGVY